MASLYHSLFTEKGLELLRTAIQSGTKLGITHMSFGDGNGALPVPDAKFTQMVKEVYRVQLNRLAPSKENANWLEADGVIPSAIGGFNIREVGLWAGNVMVAYANYPPTYKPTGDQGTAQIKTIRIVLQIDNTANFELKIDASVVMATIQSVEDAKQELIQYVDNTKLASLKGVGATYDPTKNDQEYFDKGLEDNNFLILEDGTTRIDTFINPSKHLIGFGKVNVNVDPNKNAVCVQLRSNSITENMNFNSINNNKEWQRAEIGSNTISRKNSFSGFQHQSSAPNAWGLFVNNASNILIDNNSFSNNSQSDIALVDNVRDVTIINALNEIDGGVTLNVEPNARNGTKGLNVIGGLFKTVYLLENDVQAVASDALLFSGARIKNLCYDGSGASFISCSIDKIFNQPDNLNRIYAGQLRIDNASLSENLIEDPYLVDISLYETDYYWKMYEASSNQLYKKIVGNTDDGVFVRINDELNCTGNVSTRDGIDIDENATYVLCGRIRTINADSLNVFILSVAWFDANDSEILSQNIVSNRTISGTDVGWKNDVSILIPPKNAKKVRVYIGASTNSKVKTDISFIGLYKLSLNTGNSNFNNIISNIAKPHFNRRYKRNKLPISPNTWDKNVNFIKGDIIYKDSSNISLGEEYEWLCVESGIWNVQNPKFINLSKSNLSAVVEYDFGTISANSKKSVDISLNGIKFDSMIAISFDKLLNGCKLSTEIKELNKVTVYIENQNTTEKTIEKGNITIKTI